MLFVLFRGRVPQVARRPRRETVLLELWGVHNGEKVVSTTASFDTGLRERIDEDTVWHGSGWLTDDDELVTFVGRRTKVVLDARNRTHVYHEGRRAW